MFLQDEADANEISYYPCTALKSVNATASAEFIVIGDGKELWRSDPLKKSDGARPLSVDISGVRRLLLKVTGNGQGMNSAPADWVRPLLIK